MNRFVSVVCLLALGLGPSCAAPPADRSEALVAAVTDSSALGESAGADSSATNRRSGRVVVYYFHRTMRCVECLEMEALTVKALTKFAREQEREDLILKVLNVEEPENEHFIDDFGIYFNTVIVTREENDVRTEWKDIGKRAWDLTPYPDEFVAFLQKEVASYLAVG